MCVCVCACVQMQVICYCHNGDDIITYLHYRFNEGKAILSAGLTRAVYVQTVSRIKSLEA